jgi:hypothetical protein
MVDGNKTTFERAFWAFTASIDGFQYCRPPISIGDIHLYGKYKVKFLVTIACDVNNEFYPLCFAIVKKRQTIIIVGF